MSSISHPIPPRQTENCILAQKIMLSALSPPIGLYFLGDEIVTVLKEPPTKLFGFVEKSDYTTAMKYLGKKGFLDQAFITRRGWNAIHLIFEETDKQSEALLLLDEIADKKSEEFFQMNPFEYTLSRHQYPYFTHLATKYASHLTPKVTLKLLHLMTDRAERVEVCQPLLTSLCQTKIHQQHLLVEGGEDSPYVKAAQNNNTTLFTLYTTALAGVQIKDAVCKKLLSDLVNKKVSHEMRQALTATLIPHLCQTNRSHFLVEGGSKAPIVRIIESDDSTLFTVFSRAVDLSAFKLPNENTLLHEIAKNNASKCLDSWQQHETADKLLKIIDLRNNEGQTAVFVGADNNNDEVVIRLIQLGANFLLPSKKGRTPYSVAPDNIFRSRKASMILRNAEYGFIDECTIAPQQKKEVMEKIQRRRADGLLLCCLKGCVEAATQLVQTYKVDPNIEDFASKKTSFIYLLQSSASEEEILTFVNQTAALTRIDILKDARSCAEKRGFTSVAQRIQLHIDIQLKPKTAPSAFPLFGLSSERLETASVPPIMCHARVTSPLYDEQYNSNEERKS